MNIFANYNQPGKHTWIIDGPKGTLELELNIPMQPIYDFCAIIGHPHPLYGGTMHNKVVTTVVAAFNNLNIPAIKFNFRGVGKSSGSYDGGIGESEDMLKIVELWLEVYPKSQLVFAGFSFGSFVAYRSACIYQAKTLRSAPLITIAPSVINFDYREFDKLGSPWLVVQGEIDEIVEPQAVYDFVESFNPPLQLLKFPETSHFFHGKLIDLKAKLTAYLESNLKVIT